MKRVLNEKEIESAMNNIKTINEIESIYLDKKTEAACMRVLAGQSSEREELAKIMENSGFLE